VYLGHEIYMRASQNSLIFCSQFGCLVAIYLLMEEFFFGRKGFTFMVLFVKECV